MISNDNLATGLGEGLYSSYNVTASNPKRPRILSLGRKLNKGSCLEFSMIIPRVEEFGSIVKA